MHALVTVMTEDGRNLHRESADRMMAENHPEALLSSSVDLHAGKAKANELAGVLKPLDTVINMAEVMAQLKLLEALVGHV